MDWITTTELRDWAKRRECQENLPLLVRKLIRSTTNEIQKIKFPSGDNVQMGGWDGILQSAEENDFVPLGNSLWEFGTTSDTKGKADDDYDKRTNNSIGYNNAESVFIFVTPRLWSNGEDWAKEKRKESKWKDVRVINAEKLEEWIELSPAVGSWLARHIGKLPPNGFQSADEFWESWSQGPKYELNPELLLGGRAENKKQLINELNLPMLSVVHSSSRQESVAFSIASIISVPELKEDFFSRAIVVDNAETFRRLSASGNKLILIARFESEDGLFYATKKGHNIIVPKGADYAGNGTSNILPRIEMEPFRKALEEMGISRELADKYSKESARSIPVLRRILKYTHDSPEWALPENIRDIIPALLLGRWDGNFSGDRELLEEMAGISYDSYIQTISVWLHSTDSPVVKIGNSWRLISPLDVWSRISNQLTRSDFSKLFEFSVKVMGEIHPKFQRPAGERYISPLGGYNIKYSEWVRKGLAQSLCLTAILGERLSFDLANTPSTEIDRVVSSILSPDNKDLWKSLSPEFPLLAEASPISFMDMINRKLEIDGGPVHTLFEEEEGFMTNMSYHSGLLWALEGLAWLPEHFASSILLLAKLANMDPGGQLANRPSNSLKEIYTVWRYQTLADWDTRMQTLRKIGDNFPEVCIGLLKTMLPDSNTVSFNNHELRWRTFEVETRGTIYNEEVYRTYKYVTELLIELTEANETQVIALVKASTKFDSDSRTKAFEKINEKKGQITELTGDLWHELRGILNHHRSCRTASWVLDEEQLSYYDTLHDELIPDNVINRNKWLFDDSWPLFKEGNDIRKVRDEDHQKKVKSERLRAASELYSELGLENIITLIPKIKYPYFFGLAIGEIVVCKEEVLSLIRNNDGSHEWKMFLIGFGFEKSVSESVDWIFEIADLLSNEEVPLEHLVSLFLGLSSDSHLWTRLASYSGDLHDLYWRKTESYFRGSSEEEKVEGITNLMNAKRFFYAIHQCYLEDNLPTLLLISLLHRAATEEAEDNYRPQPYEIERILEQLSTRDDAEKSDLIVLEWMYMSVTNDFHGRNSKILQNELAESPEFFVDVLSWVYKSDEDFHEKIDIELSEEQIANRSLMAYRLLDSWKVIPGLNNERLDEGKLSDWVSDVRTRAKAKGMMSSADICIGKLLGRYPGNDENWPGDFICSLIEGIGTDEILRTFSSSIFNKQSFTSRGVFDGGDIERERAEFYKKLANNHRINYPKVASVFDGLNRGYLEDAKRMDEDAEKTRLEN